MASHRLYERSGYRELFNSFSLFWQQTISSQNPSATSLCTPKPETGGAKNLGQGHKKLCDAAKSETKRPWLETWGSAPAEESTLNTPKGF